MELTAEALASLGTAGAAKVTDYVARLSREKPVDPPRDATPAADDVLIHDEPIAPASPLLQPRSPPRDDLEDKENAPPKRGKQRRVDGSKDAEDAETQARLADRLKRKRERAALTRPPKEKLEVPAFLVGKKLKKGLSSDSEQSDEVEQQPKRQKKPDLLAQLGGLAARNGATVGQGRITTKPGFLRAGAASERVKTGVKQAKPLPDLAFNELDFLNRPRHARSDTSEERPAKRQNTKHQAEASKHFEAQPLRISPAARPAQVSAVAHSPPRAQQTRSNAVSMTPSATSAMSLLRRRLTRDAPASEVPSQSLCLEVPENLFRPADAIEAPLRRPMASPRRSQSAPQSQLERSPMRPPLNEPPASAHSRRMRGIYSESDDDCLAPPRRPPSAATVEESARASAREQHVFLADITAGSGWSPARSVALGEHCQGDGPEHSPFEVYADPEDGQFEPADTFSDRARYDRPFFVDDTPVYDGADADTVLDEDIAESLNDHQPVYRAGGAAEVREYIGMLPPPSWLRSPVAPRPPSPPPLPPRHTFETTAPPPHDAEAMLSFWYRCRP